MTKIKDAASEFLANKRVAVTGVSRHPKDHGSNVVYQRLRERGYDVFAVNPNVDKGVVRVRGPKSVTAPQTLATMLQALKASGVVDQGPAS